MTSAPTKAAGRAGSLEICLFRERGAAERAFAFIYALGYTQGEVSVLMSDETRRRHFTHGSRSDLADRAIAGAGVGSTIGCTAGAILAALIAVASPIVIPGVGMIIAGPIAAAIAGAGAGGLAGGLLGALSGLGVPEDSARVYEDGIVAGGVVFGVRPRSEDHALRIERAWRDLGGERIHR